MWEMGASLWYSNRPVLETIRFTPLEGTKVCARKPGRPGKEIGGGEVYNLEDSCFVYLQYIYFTLW